MNDPIPTIVDFRDHLAAAGLSGRTISEYVKFGRRLLRWCANNGTDLGRITPGDLHRFGETLPRSWASRKQARTAVSHLMRMVGRDDGCWMAVPVPRKPRGKSRALSPRDAAALRTAALMYGGREGAAVIIGLYTAARRAEIAAMRWDGVDIDDGTISWVRTKTGDVAELPLHPVLTEVLDRLPRTSAYLFPGDRGRPHVTPATVWTWVKLIGATVGVEVATHQLRHTALATALDATQDLRAVQDLAGHRDPATTAIYTRTTARRLAAALEAIDAYDLDDPR